MFPSLRLTLKLPVNSSLDIWLRLFLRLKCLVRDVSDLRYQVHKDFPDQPIARISTGQSLTRARFPHRQLQKCLRDCNEATWTSTNNWSAGYRVKLSDWVRSSRIEPIENNGTKMHSRTIKNRSYLYWPSLEFDRTTKKNTRDTPALVDTRPNTVCFPEFARSQIRGKMLCSRTLLYRTVIYWIRTNSTS